MHPRRSFFQSSNLLCSLYWVLVNTTKTLLLVNQKQDEGYAWADQVPQASFPSDMWAWWCQGLPYVGGLSCFHGTRPLVPIPFYRNARPHFSPGASHGFTQSHNRKTPSRHTTANSTHKHDSTEAETSVCPNSPPVPGELLIPDGNGKSHTSQKHTKVTTTSHRQCCTCHHRPIIQSTAPGTRSRCGKPMV